MMKSKNMIGIGWSEVKWSRVEGRDIIFISSYFSAYIALRDTILYYIILNCIILYYTVLHHLVLYSIISYYLILTAMRMREHEKNGK